MPNSLRYATWSAVSTKSQAAADKVSLDVQREKCHAAGQARGWVHVRDYTVPGQSRTAYISLTTAEKHIPQLHQMLEDAYSGAFDVLVVYDLDRFRTLMDQVFFALSDCNVQLFVLSDPREPVPPCPHLDTANRPGITATGTPAWWASATPAACASAVKVLSSATKASPSKPRAPTSPSGT